MPNGGRGRLNHPNRARFCSILHPPSSILVLLFWVSPCLRVALPCLTLAGCTNRPVAPATAAPTSNAAPDPIDAAIARGVDFLKKSQNPDGSWGTGLETRGLEIYASVPGSHDAFRVATTALCVMALRDAGLAATDPHRKAVEYLVTKGNARRDDGTLMYNTWAHTYALQALAVEMRHPPFKDDPRLKSAAQSQLDRLIRYQTHLGGWNYYDFVAQTQTPSMGPTSFGTAAGLVALYEARQSGIAVPDKLIRSAINRLEECRLPDGAYLYGSDYKFRPQALYNRPKGSVGRTQSGNFALWLWSSKKVGEKDSVDGLEAFFRDHDFMNMGRRRPYPHEAWYFTSGYYYYFGHYYAALLVEKLGPAQGKKRFGEQLAAKILPYQEPDGSWWDYAMWDYHKPYGTAFAVMSLVRLRGADTTGLTTMPSAN
jgi:hypothetical protein